jgi:hypothetical protein
MSVESGTSWICGCPLNAGCGLVAARIRVSRSDVLGLQTWLGASKGTCRMLTKQESKQ